MTTIITGARIRLRRRNRQLWLYFGRIKIGRIEGGTLEVKDHHKGGAIERAPLLEVSRQMAAIVPRSGKREP